MKKRGYYLESVIKIINFSDSKRSQISFLIIIGIVLIGVILLVFLLNTDTDLEIFKRDKISPGVLPIYAVINDCIEQRSIDAIRIVGLQGGYIIIPENYLETDISNTAYGLYDNRNVLLSIDKIEKEIQDYIELTIPYCIDSNDFPDSEITPKKPNANVKIKQDSVSVKAILPVSVSKGENTFELDAPYEIELPIRLKKIHDTANLIINKQLEDLDYVDMTFLTNLEFNTIFIPFNESNLIYVITDYESEIDDISYSFMFGAKLR